jgi:hypothetical protein
MVVEWTRTDRSNLFDFFNEFKVGRTVIFPALSTNRGTIWVDSLESPSVVRLQIGIINAVTGDSLKPVAVDIIKMINPNELVFFSDESWIELLKKVYGDRFGIKKRTKMFPAQLNKNRLRGFIEKLPAEFILEQLDLETIHNLSKDMLFHIMLFFGSPEEFTENGFGYCIKHEGRVVSIASTLTPFKDEFEIEVRTENSAKYRQKGLATIVSSALILHALDKGYIPHWDAANEISVKLALKLGYTDPFSWEAFYIKTPENS